MGGAIISTSDAGVQSVSRGGTPSRHGGNRRRPVCLL